MRDGLAALAEGSAVELVSRIGITTGEVLVGGEDQPVVGDPMNTAARLQTAAEPGEILIGEPTYRLVRDAVLAEPVAPLTLKGKTGSVPAHRLLRVASLSPIRARRLDAPMVGREREHGLLRQAFERTVSDRACHLFTVLGAAGAGKSRLVEEFLTPLDHADVMRGRCLAYGDGITFFPVAEAMKEALGLGDFDGESAVQDRIHAALAGEEHAEEITANLAKLLARGRAVPPRRPFGRSAGSSRLVGVRGRWSWCSTTSTGGSRRSSTWSSTWPTGLGRRSILLPVYGQAGPARRAPAWAGGKTQRDDDPRWAPLSDEEMHRS